MVDWTVEVVLPYGWTAVGGRASNGRCRTICGWAARRRRGRDGKQPAGWPGRVRALRAAALGGLGAAWPHGRGEFHAGRCGGPRPDLAIPVMFLSQEGGAMGSASPRASAWDTRCRYRFSAELNRLPPGNDGVWMTRRSGGPAAREAPRAGVRVRPRGPRGQPTAAAATARLELWRATRRAQRVQVAAAVDGRRSRPRAPMPCARTSAGGRAR